MISDKEYRMCVDGQWITIPSIDKLCTVLKEKFIRQQEENQRLKEENEKLKNGIWEKEEIARMKNEYEQMKQDYYHGFPISEKEWQKIREWQKQYISHNANVGSIGGVFTYKFYPTSIGVSGVCVAPNGDEFEFQEIG